MDGLAKQKRKFVVVVDFLKRERERDMITGFSDDIVSLDGSGVDRLGKILERL